MTLKELQQKVAQLTPAEKAELVQMLAPEITHTWPGIERSTDVAGGAACIVRTRIPVWTLARYRELGWTEAQILSNFPTLRASDLVNAWAYVAAHGDEIAREVRANEEA